MVFDSTTPIPGLLGPKMGSIWAKVGVLTIFWGLEAFKHYGINDILIELWTYIYP